MSESSPVTSVSASQLKLCHDFYSRFGKMLWIAGSVFILAGGLQVGGALYAILMNAPISTSANYGTATSGGGQSFDQSDSYGSSLASGLIGLLLGCGSLALAFSLRKGSLHYLNLPEASKAAPGPSDGRTWEQVLWGSRGYRPESQTDELLKLQTLLNSGALTKDEFAVQKAEVLSRPA